MTGWTWEYIDEFVTIPRLLEMSEYWEKRPPVHELVAGYLGYSKKERALPEAAPVEDVGAAFLRDFVAAGGKIEADLGVT